MEVVKFNRIKAVLAETNKQGKRLAQQLGKDPTTVSNWCTSTIPPDLKTLAEIADILMSTSENCSLIPNKTMTGQSAERIIFKAAIGKLTIR